MCEAEAKNQKNEGTSLPKMLIKMIWKRIFKLLKCLFIQDLRSDLIHVKRGSTSFLLLAHSNVLTKIYLAVFAK